MMFLPKLAGVLDESVVVLDYLTTLEPEYVHGANRIVSLSDLGRRALYMQYIGWLARWEFREVSCPNCGTEFDPTLGLSVRPD